MNKTLQDGEREVIKIRFDLNCKRLKQNYLNIEGVKPGIIYTTKYDENSDIGLTYLVASKKRRQD